MEPNRKSRANWFLIALIVLLCIVSFVQGIILFTMRSERDGLSTGIPLRERLRKIWPGLADTSRQAALSPAGNQVVLWETTDDLEQIRGQINRLLRDMTATLGSTIAGGPFPGIAIQRGSGNRPPPMPIYGRDLDQLQREIEQIFEDAYNESQPSTLLARVNRGWDMVSPSAAMNIEDQGSNYVVTVALPGYDKQGIKISLEGRLLVIKADQPPHAQATAARYATDVRRGQFHTHIMMPDNIEGTGAQAAFEHDVLQVQIPKAAETNSLVRSIAIR